MERLAKTVNEIAHAVPSRRERKLHVGLFGYSRGVGRTRLPRAIPFTAALYSLGVPPEFIGTGRALRQLVRRRLDVEEFYRNLRADLRWAGGHLNRENLALLAKRSSAWAAVQEDVRITEEFLGEELGPRTVNHYLHRNAASNVYYLWRAGRPFTDQIIEAGKLRRSLG